MNDVEEPACDAVRVEADAAWKAVRQDYEDKQTPVGEIVLRHGVSLDQLHLRRRSEGWRREASAASPARAPKLAGRIIALFERQISLIENRVEEEQDMSAADLRLLEAATKTVDKLIEAQKAKDKKDVSGPKPQRLSRELEAVRQRLIERVNELGEG